MNQDEVNLYEMWPDNLDNTTVVFLELLAEVIDEVEKVDRNKEIIALRFGLGGDSFTLQELGTKYQLTRERVRQICARFIKRIRTRAKYQLKKQRTTGSSYLFVMFLIEKIKPHQDNALFRLASLISELEMPSTIIQLITHLIYNKETDLTSQISEMISNFERETRSYKKRIESGNYHFERIFNQIVWPKSVKHIQIERFMNIRPKRVVNKDSIGETGIIYSSKLQRNVMYESLMELRFIDFLERAPRVKSFVEQPFSISYEYKGEEHEYFPDFLLLLDDGTPVVVEIKPPFLMGIYHNLLKWEALQKFCEQYGLCFVVTDGYRSIQGLANTTINEKFEVNLIDETSKKEVLKWKDYKAIRDRYDIDHKQMISCILKHNLIWSLNPFCLRKAEHEHVRITDWLYKK